MTPETLLILLARWLHILSAALAIGVPIYVRFVLMPAMSVLDEEPRSRLKEALARRWRIIVYVLITIFLATGFYNFLGAHAHWREFPEGSELRRRYHMYFGIKLVVALVMFFLSSALAGRSVKLEFIRTNARMWLMVLVLLGLFMVVISGTMRFMKLS